MKKLLTILPFVFLLACVKPPEPDAEITISPNPHASNLNLMINLPKESEVKIFLYGPDLEEENLVFNNLSPAGQNNYLFHIPGISGAYYMDVIIDGKAKRFKLFKDVNL